MLDALFYAVWDGRAWGICRDMADHYRDYFQRTGAGDVMGFFSYDEAARHCREWPKGQTDD